MYHFLGVFVVKVTYTKYVYVCIMSPYMPKKPVTILPCESTGRLIQSYLLQNLDYYKSLHTSNNPHAAVEEKIENSGEITSYIIHI